MSAWYVFSALGFYPVAPGSTAYQLGSPAVVRATLKLENGKIFRIETRNQDSTHVYVQQVLLNGRPLRGYSLEHDAIMKGGTLTFIMSDKPSVN
jgi:putative alpha-1,2-mannosidase